MASRIRNPFRSTPRHRAAGAAVTTLREPTFQPRHCAGELDNGLCLSHDHPGDALLAIGPLTNFAGLHEPLVIPRPAAWPITSGTVAR
jgi:hypothetical protein